MYFNEKGNLEIFLRVGWAVSVAKVEHDGGHKSVNVCLLCDGAAQPSTITAMWSFKELVAYVEAMHSLVAGTARIRELPEKLRKKVCAGLRDLPDTENCDRLTYFPEIPGESGEEIRIHQGDHSSLIRLDDY